MNVKMLPLSLSLVGHQSRVLKQLNLHIQFGVVIRGCNSAAWAGSDEPTQTKCNIQPHYYLRNLYLSLNYHALPQTPSKGYISVQCLKVIHDQKFNDTQRMTYLQRVLTENAKMPVGGMLNHGHLNKAAL